MTDEGLIELFWQRREEAVSALQEKYGGYCAAVARQFLTDSRDVEECVSDCALAVWNAIPPTRPTHFRGWLGAIVRHRAIALGKQNGRRPPTVDDTAMELAPCLVGEGQRELEAAELGRAISDFLRTQKPACRAAFLRRYWYEEPVEQVARHMGWSVSKTKSSLFRTRGKLREYLEKEEFL